MAACRHCWEPFRMSWKNILWKSSLLVKAFFPRHPVVIFKMYIFIYKHCIIHNAKYILLMPKSKNIHTLIDWCQIVTNQDQETQLSAGQKLSYQPAICRPAPTFLKVTKQWLETVSVMSVSKLLESSWCLILKVDRRKIACSIGFVYLILSFIFIQNHSVG